MQLVFRCDTFIKGSWLARKLKPVVEIWEVEADAEDCVGEVESLAQLFELFG